MPGEKHDEVIDIVNKNPKQLKSAITEIEEVFGEKMALIIVSASDLHASKMMGITD